MGLGITAFRNMRMVTQSQGCRAYSANGVDRLDGVPKGYYIGDDIFRFGMPYSYYNRWREWLAIKFTGIPIETIWEDYEQYEHLPFFELINFGDNEGSFGPVTSRALAQDFAAHFSETLQIEWEYFNLYRKFQHAFTLAADHGLLIFH
jgi:hypothetical protein